jgi:hypothetical protein
MSACDQPLNWLNCRSRSSLRDRQLLSPDKFRAALKERGVFVVEQHLEALHRTRILVPMLRVARDPRELAAAVLEDGGPDASWYFAHWKPSRPADFRQERTAGRVYDPAREQFKPWNTYRGTLPGKVPYDESVFLYSPHQLVAVPLVREILPQLRWWRGKSLGSLNVDRPMRERWIAEAERRREIAFAASAIEPAYYSQIIGWLRLRGFDEPEEYQRWRQKLPLLRLLRWLGINAACSPPQRSSSCSERI